MSKDLYPIDYYISVFARECVVNSSGKTEDGLSKELISAVYQIASDRADMSRMCRVLRKYGVNTLSKLKDTPQVEMTKWRNAGSKTIEKFAHIQSLPSIEEESEVIVRRYIVGELKKQIDAAVTEAYQAGAKGEDMIFDCDEILNNALFENRV